MKVEIEYLKRAKKFFNKNSHIISIEKTDELLISAAKKIFQRENTNIDIKELNGKFEGLYRIRYNKIRILFKVENNQLSILMIVNDIDFRGDVYKLIIFVMVSNLGIGNRGEPCRRFRLLM